MWDDVVIGTGEGGCTTIRVFDIEGDHSISQNRVIFRCSDCYLGFGVTIFKDTPEGEQLTTMIQEKKTLEEIQVWLDDLIITHIDKNRLKAGIDRKLDQAFREGRRTKAKEIQAALSEY
jgi:hypothetical protein